MLPDLPKDYRQGFPQIDETLVRILWHCGWYDGPLDGVALCLDKHCWFQINHSDADVRDRADEEGLRMKDLYARFLLFELTEEEFAEEKYWHDLFREKVGTHWDYDEQGKLKGGTVRPQEFHHEFYDAVKNRKPLQLSTDRILGWFETIWGSTEADGE